VCAPASVRAHRGSRKKSPFAGQLAAEKAAGKAALKGVRSVRVRVKGIGRGRESSLRALINSEIEVTAIEDVTPIPHNGCRPRKQKRR
jgi:small subunit ribosomal protein S11